MHDTFKTTYHLDQRGRLWTLANGFHWRPATADEMQGYVLDPARLVRPRTNGDARPPSAVTAAVAA